MNSWVRCIILVWFCTRRIAEMRSDVYVTAWNACVMYSAWKSKDNYDTSLSVFVVQFNGFMSLTSDFDVTYSY